MGKYSGILICSDFDGTLRANKTVSRENIDAIKYFCENGGHFTVCTGRGTVNFTEDLKELEFNVPLLILNGTAFYDIKTGEISDETFMRDMSAEFIEKSLCEIEGIKEVRVHTKERSESVYPNDLSKLRDLDLTKVYKLVYDLDKNYADKQTSDRIKRRFEEMASDSMSVIRSCLRLIEIQDTLGSKGLAARKLANRLGDSTLVCVGDYENDISMIEEADIGYAVSNAAEELKAVADRVTVSAADHAIAKIIYEL